MEERKIRRGDIYYADLNPVIGSEQGGRRPVLIISNDKAKLPTHTIVINNKGLDKNSIILLEQIRTIDKQRLREFVGTLDGRFLNMADKALAISIGLQKKD